MTNKSIITHLKAITEYHKAVLCSMCAKDCLLLYGTLFFVYDDLSKLSHVRAYKLRSLTDSANVKKKEQDKSKSNSLLATYIMHAAQKMFTQTIIWELHILLNSSQGHIWFTWTQPWINSVVKYMQT